jgi:hypothetical protein
VSYFNYLEAQENKNYQKMKLEAKLKANELAKTKQKILDISEDETDTQEKGKVVGSDEIRMAEGLLRSSSSYVEMN